MSGILLDTNAYAAFKQGQADAIEIVQRAPQLAFNSIVLGELLAGFAVGSREAKNRAELQQFLASDRVHILHVDELQLATTRPYIVCYGRKDSPFLPTICGSLHRRFSTNMHSSATMLIFERLIISTLEPRQQTLHCPSLAAALPTFPPQP